MSLLKALKMELFFFLELPVAFLCLCKMAKMWDWIYTAKIQKPFDSYRGTKLGLGLVHYASVVFVKRNLLPIVVSRVLMKTKCPRGTFCYLL